MAANPREDRTVRSTSYPTSDPTGRWRWTGSKWEPATETLSGVAIGFASAGLGCIGYGVMLVLFVIWTFSLGQYPTTLEWVGNSLVFGTAGIIVLCAVGGIVARLNRRWWLVAPLIAAWPAYLFMVSFTYDAFGQHPNYQVGWLPTVGGVLAAVSVTVLSSFVARGWGRPRRDQTPIALATEHASAPKRLSPALWWWATLRGLIRGLLGDQP